MLKLSLPSEVLKQEIITFEEIQYASDSGDKQSKKESYEEFLRLDQNYQAEFGKHEGALSNKEGWEINKMHQQIIKSLATYSSLMSR